MIFATPEIDASGLAVLAKIEDIRKRLGTMVGEPSNRWNGLLRRNVFAKAIRGSNTIEGYNVTVDDAVAAVEGEEPLDADQATWAEILGYRQAMTYVMQLARDPHFRFSSDHIRSLHFMMLSHDLTKGPGQWRPGYIYVRNDERGEIVYEGPDAGEVPSLIQELVDSLNQANETHQIVRAAMAHLNLVMIHPFRDGNGRMARCLQTLVLARDGLYAPVFSSIEEYLGRNTIDYYAVLAEVGQGRWHPERDALPWVRFCLVAHYRQATTLLNRFERMRRIWDELEVKVRDLGLPERSIFALADAATGLKVRNPTYRKAADISENLASRDLHLLVKAGLLEPQGEKRGRYYVASPQIRDIRRRNETSVRRIEDPFQLEIDLG